VIDVSKDIILLQKEITLKEKEIQQLQQDIESENNKLIKLYNWTVDMLNSLKNKLQKLNKNNL
jgi:uncharacterized tellurite resistance protein B-like protein